MPSGTANSSVRGAQEGLAREQTALGRSFVQQGNQLFSMGAPAFNKGLNYYATLVGGGRGALDQLLSTERGQLNELYSGAVRGLEQGGMRGGTLDSAKADLMKQKAGQISGMAMGMRPNAAAGLSQLATSGLGAANAQSHLGATSMGNAGLTYANLLNDQAQREAASRQMWGQLGGSLGQIFLGKLLGGKRGNA